jgi:hypothetical protein
MRTRAELTKTQTLSPVVGEGVAEISMMLFIKQNLCHKIVRAGSLLAIEGSWAIFNFTYETPA